VFSSSVCRVMVWLLASPGEKHKNHMTKNVFIASTSVGAGNLSTKPTDVPEGRLEPEFAGHARIHDYCSLSRSSLYRLWRAGLITSVNVRQPGKSRGRRLWVVDSIRAFLSSCQEGGTSHE